MKPDADYSGVPTAELASLMKARHVQNHKVFAINNGFDERAIARILYEESFWTNLDTADKICIALGHPGFLHQLTIIPSGYNHSATKMAEDEFFAKEIEATPAQIRKRANELRALRRKLIKDTPKRVPTRKPRAKRERTPEQIEANRLKQRERDRKKKKT